MIDWCWVFLLTGFSSTSGDAATHLHISRYWSLWSPPNPCWSLMRLWRGLCLLFWSSRSFLFGLLHFWRDALLNHLHLFIEALSGGQVSVNVFILKFYIFLMYMPSSVEVFRADVLKYDFMVPQMLLEIWIFAEFWEFPELQKLHLRIRMLAITMISKGLHVASHVVAT